MAESATAIGCFAARLGRASGLGCYAMDFPAWDPVLFDIPFLPIDIRWYGLMYVVGFMFAQWIFVRLARRGFFPVAP